MNTFDGPAIQTAGEALIDEMLKLSRECGQIEREMQALAPGSPQLLVRQLARDAFELLIQQSKEALLGDDPAQAIYYLRRLQLIRTEREQRRRQQEATR